MKLRHCLDHIDELQKHISEAGQEILRLSDKYEAALNLTRTGSETGMEYSTRSSSNHTLTHFLQYSAYIKP